MAEDFGRSLNEVVAGYQGMNQTLNNFAGGTVTPQGSMAPTPMGGAPMPAPPPPTPVFTPPPPPPPPPFIPSPAAPPGPAESLAAGYSPVGGMGGTQMQSMNLRANSPYINPYMAGVLDPNMNMPGMGMAANPNFRVFQNQQVGPATAAAPYMLSGAAPPAPLLPTPGLLRTRPGYQFARPFEGATYMGSDEARLMQQGYHSYMQGGGAAFNSAVGSAFGFAGGGVLGGLIGAAAPVPGGAAAGASWGSTIGGIGGAFAGSSEGLNYITSNLMRPAIEQRAEGVQAQALSRQFVRTGEELDITGRGLSTRGAMRLAGAARDIASESQGQITQQDVLQLTQVAGEQGLLEVAQNSDAIAKSIKGLMGLVRTMTQVTGDPDFRNNLQRLGQMKRMGFQMGQMDAAANNLAQYARMAGVDVDTAMQRQGMQGAATFRAQGLMAHQGMMTGAMAGAQAQMFESSGAMGSQQVSMLGGTEGITQRLTDMNATFMSQMSPGMMGALVTRDKNGNLTIDRDKLRSLQSGDLTFEDALQQGAGLDQQTLKQVIDRMPELQAQMGDAMGPMGMQMAMMQQVRQHSNLTGLSLRQSGHAIFGQEGGQVIAAMQDPRFQKAMLQQQRAELQQRQYEAASQQQAERDARPGLFDRGIDSLLGMGGMTRSELRRAGSPMEAFQGWSANWLAEHEERNRRAAAGMITIEGQGTILDPMGMDAIINDPSARFRHGSFSYDPTRRARGATARDARGVFGDVFTEREDLRLARESAGRGGPFRRVEGAGRMGLAMAESASAVALGAADMVLGTGMVGLSGLDPNAVEGRLDDERLLVQQERGNYSTQINAFQLEGEELAAAQKSAMEKLGGLEGYQSARNQLRELMKDSVGLGVMEADVISSAAMNEGALGELSPVQKQALIQGVGGRLGDKFEGSMQSKRGRERAEVIQDGYKSGTAGQAAREQFFRESGFGKTNFLGKGSQAAGAAAGAIAGMIGGAGAGTVLGPLGIIGGGIMGGLKGMKEGADFFGGVGNRVGEEFGLEGERSDAEQEVLAALSKPEGPFIALAAMEEADGDQWDLMRGSLERSFEKRGKSKKELDQLIAAGKRIYKTLSKEAQEVLRTRGIGLLSEDVQKALKSGNKKALDAATFTTEDGEEYTAFEADIYSVGGLVHAEARGEQLKRLDVQLQKQGLSGSGGDYKVLMQRIKDSSGRDRKKYEEALDTGLVNQIATADLDDPETMQRLGNQLLAHAPQGESGDLTLSKFGLEGVESEGTKDIETQMQITKDMMAEFGADMKVQTEQSIEQTAHLRTIAEHFAGKKAVDKMLENVDGNN